MKCPVVLCALCSTGTYRVGIAGYDSMDLGAEPDKIEPKLFEHVALRKRIKQSNKEIA